MPTTTVYSKLTSFIALSLLPTRIIPYRVPEESAGPLAGGQERGGGEGEAGEAVLTPGEGELQPGIRGNQGGGVSSQKVWTMCGMREIGRTSLNSLKSGLTFNREQVDKVPLVHHSHDVVVAPHAHEVVLARADTQVSELRFSVVIDTVSYHK